MILLYVKDDTFSGFSQVINQCKTSCLQVAAEDAFGLSSLAIQTSYKTEFSTRIKQRKNLKELLPILFPYIMIHCSIKGSWWKEDKQYYFWDMKLLAPFVVSLETESSRSSSHYQTPMHHWKIAKLQLKYLNTMVEVACVMVEHNSYIYDFIKATFKSNYSWS